MILAVVIVGAMASAPAQPVDLRSLELLRERCSSRIALREIVLFGNGTARLREGPVGEVTMRLGELGRAELEAMRRRLAEVDFGAVGVVASGPDGDWIDRCRLVVEAGAAEPIEVEYGQFDSGSLELEKLRRIVQDLVDVARGDGSSSELPAGYLPEIGDRLERADGAIFEVVDFTSDGRGVELASDDPPLTVFIDRDQVRVMFRRRVAADDAP